MDCFGSGSKVITPSGPVLLPPLGRELVPLFVVGLPVEDSLAESSVTDSVSEGDPGESYDWIGLGGMGEGSPQR
jgi:hypothetical protein